jgi:hypothetical protein
MASAMALFGPWPDSSMRKVEVVRHSRRRLAMDNCVVPHLHRLHHQVRGIVLAMNLYPQTHSTRLGEYTMS